MRSSILAGAILFTVAYAAAADEPVTRIASGIAGGTYHDVYAENLVRELAAYGASSLETSGSGENYELLVAGKAQLAFVQADIYASRIQEEPDFLKGQVVLGRLADECIYIAGRKDGPVKSVRDLGQPVGERAARISVGAEESGMTGSWDYLLTLKPSLAETSVLHSEGIRALKQLAEGELDAVAWVTDPNNLGHKMLQNVSDNDTLGLMPLDDPKLANTLPDGTRVYELRRVTTKKGLFRSQMLDTLCTSALVVGRRDLMAPGLEEAVTKLLQESRDRIVSSR
jgi:TRAP-type uncharacterized transport system substrate-binding protein